MSQLLGGLRNFSGILGCGGHFSAVSFFFLTATRTAVGHQARNLSTNVHSVNLPHPVKHPFANLSDGTPSSPSFMAQPAETIRVLLNRSECIVIKHLNSRHLQQPFPFGPEIAHWTLTEFYWPHAQPYAACEHLSRVFFACFLFPTPSGYHAAVLTSSCTFQLHTSTYAACSDRIYVTALP